MGKYLLMAGLLINMVYILVNRFVKQLPDWLAIPVLLIGIALMIAGLFLK